MPHHLRFCSHRFLSVLLWWKIIKRLQWVASNNTWVKRFQIPWNNFWKGLKGGLLLADSGSKVNGLKQPFILGKFTINFCRFYQMLEVITERDGMECVADGFFLVVLRGLNWVSAWMESYNPFASVVDSVTSGMNTLRAEWQHPWRRPFRIMEVDWFSS